MLVVQKFGGSSLKTPEYVRRAAEKAVKMAETGAKVVCVVSARGNTTDRLAAEAAAVSANPDKRELDTVLAAGEQVSAGLLAMAVKEMGQKAVSFTGWQAGIKTNSAYGNGEIVKIMGTCLRKELEKGKIVVVAGFQGISPSGNITTLGRGGSDTTAVALAAYLDADRCMIYTDVDGIYDKDPRIFPDAVKFSKISYDEALALAHSGAKVLHERCVEIGKACHVPIQVLSSFRPGAGTLVTDI